MTSSSVRQAATNVFIFRNASLPISAINLADEADFKVRATKCVSLPVAHSFFTLFSLVRPCVSTVDTLTTKNLSAFPGASGKRKR